MNKGTSATTKDSLEQLYSKKDPFEYETTADDNVRKIKLSEALSNCFFRKALDIGCGDGFITRDLPAREIVAFDLSENAIEQARERQLRNVFFEAHNIFDFPFKSQKERFDLLIVTGLLYPKWIGNRMDEINGMLDHWAQEDATIVSCHIEDWGPEDLEFRKISETTYPYREFQHKLQVYKK